MKKILTVICTFCCFILHAQELTVKSFKENTKDLAASTSIRKDNNDEPCALVKVQLTAAGAQFEPNVVGNIAYKVNEYWVYLPKGSKHLKVKHPNYLTKDIVFADYNVPFLQSKMTYELVIAIPEAYSTPSVVTSQYLIFKVNPTDALVEVGGDLWENNNGIARKFVPFGDYNYTVQAKDYHPISSSVSVLDPNNKVEVNVNLKPAFGKVTVKETSVTNGANVYIDNKLIGKVPLTIDKIGSGSHQIRIVKAMYKSYEATFTVNDDETTSITPNLEANFSVIRFTVDNDAEIWINDERKGIGEWRGNLEYGDYKVETRKVNHRPQSMVCTISSSADEQTFKLTAPTPIYGSLNVDVTPDGANVFLDGKNVGETPLFLQQVLIGKHLLSIEKTGYNTEKQTVTIGENTTQAVKTFLQRASSLQNENNEDVLNVTTSKGGELYSRVSDKSTRYLKIAGIMDARDFNFIKNNLKELILLDISNVKIVAYSGYDGTSDNTSLYSEDEIPKVAFIDIFGNGMQSLNKVILPKNINKIQGGAFANAKNLKTINIPEGVTYIGSGAFRGCISLNNITLPSTLKKIDDDAFYGCWNLRKVIINACSPPWSPWCDAFDHTIPKDAILYVPRGCMDVYKKSYNLRTYFRIVEQ